MRTAAAAVTALLVALPGAAHAQVPGPGALPPPGAVSPPPVPPPAFPSPPASAPLPGAYGPYAVPATTPGALPPALTPGSQELWRRNSPAMIGAGAAMIAAGTLGAIIGSALFSAGAKEVWEYPTACFTGSACVPTQSSKSSALKGGGIAMIAIGTLAVAVGIPLFAVGLKKVANKPPPTALIPTVKVGAAGAALAWQL